LFRIKLRCWPVTDPIVRLARTASVPLPHVQLEVSFSSSAMLRVVWLAGLSRGKLTVETPHEVAVGAAAAICLTTPARRIALDGVVQRCSPHARGYSVDVQIPDIGSNAALAAELC
jgi:hypothetical protein